MQPKSTCFRGGVAGFTLTEVMVTVAIVGIVSGIGVVIINSAKKVAKQELPTLTGPASYAVGIHAQQRRAITDGTSEAAVALGFPPDVRGVINAGFIDCVSGSPKDPYCTGKTKPAGWMDGPYYAHLKLQTIRASGVLETIDEEYFLIHQNAALDVRMKKEFSVSPGDLVPQGSNGTINVDSWSAIGDPKYNPAMVLSTNFFCYQNGTCDPVTYVFLDKKYCSMGGATKTVQAGATALSVSMTGSITSRVITIPEQCNP